MAFRNRNVWHIRRSRRGGLCSDGQHNYQSTRWHDHCRGSDLYRESGRTELYVHDLTYRPASFTSAAGTSSVSITAPTGCTWTAMSNNTSWLTVSSGASGSGSGTVTYAVTTNTTSAARNGTLTIGGQTHSVSQTGQSCSYSITPTGKSFTSAAGTSSVSITAPVGCTWTTTSSASWLTVTGGASGSGNGTVNYAVTTNTTSAARNATLTIGGQTHTVSQAARAPLCKAYVAAAQYTVDIGGLMRYVGVAADSTCSWMVTSNASWITAFGSGRETACSCSAWMAIAAVLHGPAPSASTGRS